MMLGALGKSKATTEREREKERALLASAYRCAK